MLDLFALKLRGGRTRLADMLLLSPSSGQIWLPGRRTSACFRSPLACTQPAEAHVASFTPTHFGGFGFHVAPQEQRKHLLWRRGSAIFTCMCVRVKPELGVLACYLRCRSRTYNRGHRILSNGGNTNLEADLWPQGVALCLTASSALLDWCYQERLFGHRSFAIFFYAL